MKKFSFRFFVASVATGCTLLALLSLGFWQLERLKWKEDLIIRLNDETTLSFATLDELIVNYHTVDNLELSKIRLKGEFIHNREVKISPRTYHGLAGSHVLTPFKLDSGKVIFVNRGWIPHNPKQHDMVVSQPSGHQEFQGYVIFPQKPNVFVPKNDLNSGAFFHIDLDDLESWLIHSNPEFAGKVIHFYAVQRSTAESSTYPIPIPLNEHLKNDHLEYAITWFALAFFLAMIYIVYIRKNYIFTHRNRKS